MKLAIYNGIYVGSAEWRAPGEVVLDVEDPNERRFFETYFATEETFLGGPVDVPHMTSARRDATEESFAHAAFALSAYAYMVRDGGEPAMQRTGET